MIDMLAARTTVLLQMKLFSHRFSVLGRCIIFSLTFSALEGNDIAHSILSILGPDGPLCFTPNTGAHDRA